MIKKKEKRYKFNNLGYVQLLWDLKQEKLGKINSFTNVGLMLAMFGLGLLSKELMILMVANIGIGKVTSWLVG